MEIISARRSFPPQLRRNPMAAAAPPSAPPALHPRLPLRRFHVRAFAASVAPTALADFRQWIAGAGAVVTAASPALVPEGLGLVAARDLSAGDTVAEVPKRLWIDATTIADSEIGRACSGLKPWVAVALFVLRERMRGGQSTWAPYLRLLPSETDSTLFWSEEELAQIEGTQLLSTTLAAKEYIRSEFATVEEGIIQRNKDLFPGAITQEDFVWAFATRKSRTFSSLRGDNLALIPFADLVNHSSAITSEDSYGIKAKGLFGRDIVFSLQTPVPVKRGEQIYIQYDAVKSNAELALDYGFIELRSERDVYTLMLRIPESDPFYGDKLDIAELNGLGETAYFDIVSGSSLPPQMLPYLRLVSLGGTDAFLLESIFRNSIWGHLELPVSHDNEESMCRAVRDACNSALSAYHTTLEEDEGVMQQSGLQQRMRIAVAIRTGEKRVLRQIDDIFREREGELETLEYYQERRLRDLGLTGDNSEIIFWETR